MASPVNGEPVFREITGWLLMAVSLFGFAFVILIIVDQVRGQSGLTPVVNEAGEAIEQVTIIVLIGAVFFFALGMVRP
jgi:hypothetical protein